MRYLIPIILLLIPQVTQYGTATRFGSTQTLIATNPSTFPISTNRWYADDPANTCGSSLPGSSCTANLQTIQTAHDSVGNNSMQTFGSVPIVYHTNQLHGHASFDFGAGADFAFYGTIEYYTGQSAWEMWAVVNLECDQATVGNCTPNPTSNYGVLFSDRDNTNAPTLVTASTPNPGTANLYLFNSACAKVGSCTPAASTSGFPVSGTQYVMIGLTYSFSGGSAAYNFYYCAPGSACTNVGSGTTTAGAFSGTATSFGTSGSTGFTYLGQVVDMGFNHNGVDPSFQSEMSAWWAFEYNQGI